MKIIFDCLGFSRARVFLQDSEERIHPIGYMVLERDYEFKPNQGIYSPSAGQVVAEYNKQFAERGVSFSKEIVYAG